MNNSPENIIAKQIVEPKRILLVDDEHAVGLVFKKLSENMNCHIELAYTGEEGFEKGVSEDWHLILLDVRLPGMTGLDLYKRLRESKGYFRCAAISGFWNEVVQTGLRDAGCYVFIWKPVDFFEKFFVENLLITFGCVRKVE